MTPTFEQVSQEIDRIIAKNKEKSDTIVKDLESLAKLVEEATEDYVSEIHSLRTSISILTSQVEMVSSEDLMKQEMRH